MSADALTSDDAKLSHEAIREIVRRRHTALLEKWFSGKATDNEAKEIAYILEQLPAASARATTQPAEPISEKAATNIPAVDSQPVRRTGYQHPLATYAARYATDERTIKRWIAKGRQATPPDVTPLDDPSALPGWWYRVSRQRPPEGILTAAAGAPSKQPESSPEKKLSEKIAAGVNLSASPDAKSSINLTTIETSEGLALKHARIFVAATYQKLDAAYSAGNDDEIRLWQPRWEKATETLRRAEISERDAQKHRGDLIALADVTADLAQFLHVLKTIRASAPKRILARVTGLPVETIAALRTAIELERDREDDALRNLQTLRSPIELTEKFELEATT